MKKVYAPFVHTDEGCGDNPPLARARRVARFVPYLHLFLVVRAIKR